MEREKTVFIVDDDDDMVKPLVRVIEAIDLKPKRYRTAKEFLDNYQPSGPACLVLDVRMPGMSGLALQQRLVEAGISLPIIVLTAYADVRMAVRAMRNGALNFLEKPWRMQELCESIQEGIELDSAKWKRLAEEDAAASRFAQLTRPERQVLERITLGKTNKTMAAELRISIRTVENRRARIMKKLQVQSREELLELVASGSSPARIS